jgi:hypothetical protein
MEPPDFDDCEYAEVDEYDLADQQIKEMKEERGL